MQDPLKEVARFAKETGWTIPEVFRGYIVAHDGEFCIDIVQKLDQLDGSGLSRFASDTEAGEQAARDGLDLITVDHEDLDGWYILNTPANRKSLLTNGYTKINGGITK
jgi:hypothetical protein